jgi:hypothetical protein
LRWRKDIHSRHDRMAARCHTCGVPPHLRTCTLKGHTRCRSLVGQRIIARIARRVGSVIGVQRTLRESNPAPQFLGKTLVVSDLKIGYMGTLEF